MGYRKLLSSWFSIVRRASEHDLRVFRCEFRFRGTTANRGSLLESPWEVGQDLVTGTGELGWLVGKHFAVSEDLSGMVHSCGEESSRQPHPAHKILESRLGSNLVEPRVRENPSMHGPFRESLFEPLQCLVPLTETFVNYGDKFGWNIPVFREAKHFIEHLLTLRVSPRNTQRVPQIHQLNDAMIGCRRLLPQVDNRFLLASCL